MIQARIPSLLAVACLFPLAVSAQEESTTKLTVRAFLNDPANPAAELFANDAPDHLLPLVLAPGELPAGQTVVVIDGKLNLYSSAKIDPASLVASAPVPKGLKQAIAIIQPRGDAKKPPCGIVFVDDSIAAFPPGESRAISFTTLPIAIQAGEHKIAVAPGKITPVPPVKSVDPYNMAQTNFLYQAGNAWVPFSEAKMKFLKDYRQVFICAVRPGGKSPTLVTLVDDTPKAAPLP
ncbi:hypothetical protein [Luteolibacter soli]|uniref:Alginate biosynthesis protein AlgF n=1 Tax=Luteolibacter soli TaxID=3135280 RepID=A0ABU9B2L6_9BACT